MKNKWIKFAGAAVAALALTASVQATPINGSIGFTGTYVQNGTTHGNLLTATSMSIVQPPTVSVITGTFFTAAGGLIANVTFPTFYTPINVNFPTLSSANLVNNNLWSVIIAGVTYSMVVSTESQTFASATQLNLAGTGLMEDGTAADNTTGQWQLGFGVSGESFTWQATSNSVPDGGATVMLLGIALSGLGLLKKKLTA